MFIFRPSVELNKIVSFNLCVYFDGGGDSRSFLFIEVLFAVKIVEGGLLEWLGKIWGVGMSVGG